ncbi:hypothetical protein PR001_g2289 [Phytophthora rubi]|uniref:DDE-1 domain-containing protein n=2 Tax=Phytophthora rubi TaxID=129364 RepID=A0A6A3P504_9STRA|nr:hypothetical protein PR001_g2289 [Phytophthora rubi]
MTQEDLAAWAKRQFKLVKAPARNTVSDILKKAATIKSDSYGCSKRRKPLKVTSPALDGELVGWVSFMEAKKLNLSIGWLTRFLKRHDMRFRLKKGEAGSVNPEVVRKGRAELNDIVGMYDPSNVFNMDEAGLCYNRAPVGDICTRKKPGVKASKTRITVAFCANADGTELLPLLYIGRARKPMCFKKKTGAELGFNYKNNAKAWMTSLIFQQWVRELDVKMRAEGRNILLLLDNAAPHVSGDLALTNVSIKMLPPNTTPCLQPMDAGIVASYKAQYRSMQIDNAVERVERGEDVEGEKAYKVDQLTAMRWGEAIWGTMSAKTISHCWRHTGLVLPLHDDEYSCDADLAVMDLTSLFDQLSTA